MSARYVAVVGAGAAGLTAALRAAEGGARVTLLNAHPRIGLKILMSGGTRCNVTHRQVSERDFHGGSRAVVRRILAAFTPEQTLRWFADLGVELKLEETGKYFPVTDDAQTVLDALLGTCERAGVEFQAGRRVVRLERCACAEAEPAGGGGAGGRGRGARGGRGGAGRGAGAAGAATAGGRTDLAPRWRLGIEHIRDSAALGAAVAAPGRTEWPLPPREPDEWLEADAVVLASGGLSFPRTGSDGTGYAMALALGHTLVPPVPALTPLMSDDPLCARAQGVTLEAELTLRAAGERVAQMRGSLLFAHFGYTGPVALDLSRHWHRWEGSARHVVANFAPDWRREKLDRAWVDSAVRDRHARVGQWLNELVPSRIGDLLCAQVGVARDGLSSQVPREVRRRLLDALTARDLHVSGTLGYEKAEVTAGGVTLAEVDPSTLESRKARGVYLCGEMLDVEGRLGGFNFQWSWSSGTVAGRAAGR